MVYIIGIIIENSFCRITSFSPDCSRESKAIPSASGFLDSCSHHCFRHQDPMLSGYVIVGEHGILKSDLSDMFMCLSIKYLYGPISERVCRLTS